jgi:hypothetical protein
VTQISYDLKNLPAEITSLAEGKPVASVIFRDVNGKNYIIISETEPVPTGESAASKSLYGYHFVVTEKFGQLWKVQDFIRDCEVDITLEYIDNSLSVTDLDEDGLAESTFLYKLSCKGDVSPDDLKLIMHEGKEKFAIRGVMDLDVNGYGFQKGEMNMDISIIEAPKEFRSYAIERWNKFKLEKIGD